MSHRKKGCLPPDSIRGVHRPGTRAATIGMTLSDGTTDIDTLRTIDSDGNITVNIKGTQVQLGQDMRLADGKLTFDIPSHNQYGLTLLKATEQQMQMVGEWGINIELPDDYGDDNDDDDDTMTEVTGDGATGPARARKR